MTHDEARGFLPDLHKGRLDPVEESGVREHLADCGECGSVSRTYAILLAGSKAQSGAHPDSSLLVRYALAVPTLGENERSRVDEHVRACASCAQEADAVREAEAAIGAREPAGNRTRFRFGLALAACVTLVLLGEAVRLRMSSGASPIRQTGDLVTLTLLTGPTRDRVSPPTVDVAPEQRTIALAVAPMLPDDLPDSLLLSVRIVGPRGDAPIAHELSAGELRNLSASSGVFVLVVPSSKLPTGTYSLYIHAHSGSERLFQTAFAVRRAE